MTTKPLRLFITAISLLSVLGLSGCMLAANNEEKTEESIDYLAMQEEAAAAYRKKQYDVAEKKYIKIARAVPKDADAWFKLGNIYARTNRPYLSIKAYREAVIRDPSLSKAWHNMGIIHIRLATTAYISLQEHAGRNEPLRDPAIQRVMQLNELLAGKKKDDMVERVGLTPDMVEKDDARPDMDSADGAAAEKPLP
ncbi:MAG: hypothetical protein BMS9Abin26_1484 [Gammaproteobacteria bacterium]|nr:MAG: hypothetical protein BMS9Abin26_1484 [Gammaproteobacteria bacterium]